MPLTKPRRLRIKDIRVLRAPEFGAKGNQVEQEVAQREAPTFEHVSWFREPHLRKLYAMGAILMLASATTGYDGMIVNTSQQFDLFKQYFPRTQPSEGNEQWVADLWLALLVNMFNIGSIVSFFITPHIADHYGRKPAIALGCTLMIAGGLTTGLCNSYEMYVAGRFVVGLGNSLSQMASPLLLTEICHPQHRGPVTAVYNCLWNVGALVVSWVGWGTSRIQSDWSWRSITLGQALPSLTQLAFLWWIPESPRYLMSKERHHEALDILAHYHAGGNELNATVQFEYREIKETMRLEQEFSKDSAYLDFFKTRGNRWRLTILISLGVISQYSGNAIFSNYMDAVYEGAGIDDQNRKLALSGGKTILDVIVTILAALHVDYFGRRPLFLISTAGMVVCFAAWTVCGAFYEQAGFKDSSPAGWAQFVFIWLFGIFYDIGFSGLLIAYALEILPFKLRAKGMMIMNITVQAILALSNQTNKIAWNRMPYHWHLMLFYTAWDFLQFIFVYFFYVETKGPTLEEIARIFDGFDAEVANINMRQVEKDIDDAEHKRRRSGYFGGGRRDGMGGSNTHNSSGGPTSWGSGVSTVHHHMFEDKKDDNYEMSKSPMSPQRTERERQGRTQTIHSPRISGRFNSLRSQDSWLQRAGGAGTNKISTELENNRDDDDESGSSKKGNISVQIYKTTTITRTSSSQSRYSGNEENGTATASARRSRGNSSNYSSVRDEEEGRARIQIPGGNFF